MDQGRDPSCSLSFLVPAQVVERGARLFPLLPPYPGCNPRARDTVQALQAYYQQPNNYSGNQAATVTLSRRVVHRAVARPGSSGSSSDHAVGFYYFLSGTSGQEFLEALNHLPAHTPEKLGFLQFHFTKSRGRKVGGDSITLGSLIPVSDQAANIKGMHMIEQYHRIGHKLLP